MKSKTLVHEFVRFIPEELEERRVYISMEYATVLHKCLCGCGKEVVTPLSPTDWKITYDGVGVSLSPSIGNWDFPCRSHYWIEGGAVRWAVALTRADIEAGRRLDRRSKKWRYFVAAARRRHVAMCGFLARICGRR